MTLLFLERETDRETETETETETEAEREVHLQQLLLYLLFVLCFRYSILSLLPSNKTGLPGRFPLTRFKLLLI